MYRLRRFQPDGNWSVQRYVDHRRQWEQQPADGEPIGNGIYGWLAFDRGHVLESVSRCGRYTTILCHWYVQRREHLRSHSVRHLEFQVGDRGDDQQCCGYSRLGNGVGGGHNYHRGCQRQGERLDSSYGEPIVAVDHGDTSHFLDCAGHPPAIHGNGQL